MVVTVAQCVVVVVQTIDSTAVDHADHVARFDTNVMCIAAPNNAFHVQTMGVKITCHAQFDLWVVNWWINWQQQLRGWATELWLANRLNWLNQRLVEVWLMFWAQEFWTMIVLVLRLFELGLIELRPMVHLMLDVLLEQFLEAARFHVSV